MIHNSSKGKLLLQLVALVVLLGVLPAVVAYADPPDDGDTGTIIIKKQTVPSGGKGFEFTDDIEDPYNFILNHGGTKTFSVLAGTYKVTETEPRVTPGGYKLTNVECWANNDINWKTYTVASRTVTIQLTDQEVECLFTNERRPPPVVGGIVVPVNKLGLLAPWLGLLALASFATLTVALVRRGRG